MAFEYLPNLGPIPLRIERSTRSDGMAKLSVAGEVDVATAGPLREALAQALRDPQVKRLVVDFAGVSFLDSSGISALVSAYRRATATQVGFAVLKCRPNVLRVLEISGLAKILVPVRTDATMS